MDTAAKGKLGRVYVTNSYITGNVDFVFGRATVVVDKSVITLKKRWNGTSAGYITAPSTAADHKGILINRSTVNGDVSAASFFLGRTWHAGGDTTVDPQTTVRNTALSAAIKTTPWTDMGGFSWKDDRFAEYRNTGRGRGHVELRPPAADRRPGRRPGGRGLAGRLDAGRLTPPRTTGTPRRTHRPGFLLSARGRCVSCSWSPARADAGTNHDPYPRPEDPT